MRRFYGCAGLRKIAENLEHSAAYACLKKIVATRLIGENMFFSDRVSAGKALASALADYTGQHNTQLMALPRGGVPVAAEVARILGLPLDIILVRKLGVPGHEEYAMGAIAEGGLRFLNQDTLNQLRLSQAQIDAVIAREQAELLRRNRLYRADRPAEALAGKTVIVIDDGLATGATMQVAVAALKQAHAKAIVVAVPVASMESCAELRPQVDRLVCLHQPLDFGGVGRWYADFTQVSDEQVIELLQQYGQ